MFRLYVEGFDLFGERQADKYYAGLEKTFDFLSRYPEAAPERLECTPPIRIYPYGSHLIVYRIESFGIWIMRVCHARENWTQFNWTTFADD